MSDAQKIMDVKHGHCRARRGAKPRAVNTPVRLVGRSGVPGLCSLVRPWHLAGFLVALLGCAMNGTAQSTNSPAPVDYSAFKIITDRNIFDASRSGRRTTPRGAPPRRVDAFTLVGTMEYEKGAFAFFDGNNSDYRKVLQSAGTIAGYKVIDVGPNCVRLGAGTNLTEMRVGMQMRREEDGAWQLNERGESYASAGGSAPSDSASFGASSGTSSSSSADMSDVLKKLMERREKETK